MEAHSGTLIAVLDDDGDDDGWMRLMWETWIASGNSNQRCPPSPMFHSSLIREPRRILTLLMCVCVRIEGVNIKTKSQGGTHQ